MKCSVLITEKTVYISYFHSLLECGAIWGSSSGKIESFEKLWECKLMRQISLRTLFTGLLLKLAIITIVCLNLQSIMLLVINNTHNPRTQF